MTRLIWVLAWTGVILWSLSALVAWGVLDLASNAFLGGTETTPRPPDSFRTGDPHPLEWLFPAVVALKSLGLGTLGFLWLTGTATILAFAWATARFLTIFFGETGTKGRLGRGSPVPRLRGRADPREPWRHPPRAGA